MAGTTQLGTFSYDMVLNYAKWTDQLSRAERAAQKSTAAIQRSIQGAVDGIGDGLNSIAGKVAAAFAVEKLIEFGKQAIDTADEVGKMAQKVGISAESLSALSVQAKLSDVGIDELQASLGKLSKNAAEAASGSKQQAAAFQAINTAISLNPNDPEQWVIRGLIQAEGGEFAQSQRSLRTALKLDPANTNANTLISAIASLAIQPIDTADASPKN